MSQHRKHRGMRTQALVAGWFATRGWPYAESAGSGRPGADVTGMPDVAVEVKARNGFEPMAWVRQAVAAASGRLPIAVIRPNGMGEQTIADWPVILRLSDLTELLHAAGYGDPTTITQETP